MRYKIQSYHKYQQPHDRVKAIPEMEQWAVRINILLFYTCGQPLISKKDNSC